MLHDIVEQGTNWLSLSVTFLRERGMASKPLNGTPGFLCIFQNISAVATLGLTEMGKSL